VKRIGYTRTAFEGDDSDARIDALERAGCTEIIHEHAAVTTRVRSKLTRAIIRLRPGDTLLVTDLDCVASSLPQLTKLLTSLRDRGIVFRALESPIDTSGPNGRVILDTLGAILRFNSAQLRARIRPAPLVSATPRRIQMMRVVVGLVARRPGITLARIASELKRLGYRPPQGGTEWSPSSIKLLLDRAKRIGILIER